MTLPSRQTLLLNLGCLLALLWLYGGDLWDGLRARSSEVSAFLAPPPVLWPAVVLGVLLVLVGVGLWGMATGRAEGFKGYRLLPILLVCALFFDLVLAEGQVPLDSETVASLSLRQFQEKAQVLVRNGKVPTSPDVLRPVVEELGQPPYLVRGERARAWSLQVRRDCSGPVQEAPGMEVGTLLYCVASGGERAWVSLVGLPAGSRFGMPAVYATEGKPYGVVIEEVPPEEPPEEGLLPFEGREEPPPASSDSGLSAPAPTP
ncbi:hypothetical protein [Melittangium boletus]|uniref:Uncharacterized protein n=1 Tax=Melittangium boletus DSM 14713 TaxID=1294270 RepID=A0A250I9L5_9BACT|nr:hypothetical protein [Melittangium boletus]ATB27903.1 hypothetical protein MEBOL_001348 [Melittangium boletus DSM 14713]